MEEEKGDVRERGKEKPVMHSLQTFPLDPSFTERTSTSRSSCQLQEAHTLQCAAKS
jgi:hypothetical protein